MTRVVWTDEAAAALSAIHDYIARDSQRYAVSVCADIVDAVSRLEALPQAGRIVREVGDPAYRELIHGNYRVVYRLASDKLVEVLTVFHGARLLRLNRRPSPAPPRVSEAPPTPAATYERARRLANNSISAVDIQYRRLAAPEAEDLFRLWTDFDFLIVALSRLRRAAILASQVSGIDQQVLAAIDEFDSSLPGLKLMRDTAEHIDEYALDSGRESSVRRQQLEVFSVDGEGPTVGWLGYQLDASSALRASQQLFRAITGAIAGVPQETPGNEHGPR